MSVPQSWQVTLIECCLHESQTSRLAKRSVTVTTSLSWLHRNTYAKTTRLTLISSTITALNTGTALVLVVLLVLIAFAIECRGQLHLHPEWLQFVTPDKQLLHFHRLAHQFSDALFSAPVGGTCGGFLCDEMVSMSTSSHPPLLAPPPAPRRPS